MRLVDSHAHLDFRQFKTDRRSVIERAWEAGLVVIINAGTDLSTSRAAVALAEEHDAVYATVGVHPHDAKSVTPTVLEEIRDLARHPKVIAVGEIGLDYYRDRSPRSAQRRAFADQLALASELDLPVVVHDRDAHDDVLAALRDWPGAGVIHSYSAGVGRLDEVLAMGFYVGISGPVTFPNAEQLREVARAVPADRLLVETDCPFLTPIPHRGRRNEPAYVRYVAEAIARTRNESLESLAEATTENVSHLFGIICPKEKV